MQFFWRIVSLEAKRTFVMDANVLLACHAILVKGHVLTSVKNVSVGDYRCVGLSRNPCGGSCDDWGGGGKVRWDTHSHAMRLEPKERLRGDKVVFLLSLLLIPICLLNSC